MSSDYKVIVLPDNYEGCKDEKGKSDDREIVKCIYIKYSTLIQQMADDDGARMDFFNNPYDHFAKIFGFLDKIEKNKRKNILILVDRKTRRWPTVLLNLINNDEYKGSDRHWVVIKEAADLAVGSRDEPDDNKKDHTVPLKKFLKFVALRIKMEAGKVNFYYKAPFKKFLEFEVLRKKMVDGKVNFDDRVPFKKFLKFRALLKKLKDGEVNFDDIALNHRRVEFLTPKEVSSEFADELHGKYIGDKQIIIIFPFINPEGIRRNK